MRIGVVGASNCILEGNFIHILSQSSLVDSVDNLSLGGSTSVLLPYAHMRYDLSAYDLIIFDFMINEYTVTKNGGYTTALGLKMMRTVIGDLHKQGIPSIFTIMPHKQSLAHDDYDFLALYQQAAEKMGCHVIDVTQAAMAAMLRGIAPDHLWSDDTHITPALHRVLAQRILNHISLLKERAIFQAGAAEIDRTGTKTPLAQPAQLVPQGQSFDTIKRQSNLCSPTYMRLPVNTPIQFHAPAGTVYGIAYNSIQFAGNVSITSAHESAEIVLYDADVETLTHKPGFDFRHRVVPFAPVRAPVGEALSGEMTFTPSRDCPATTAEVECIYGGPLAVLPVPDTEAYFQDEAELDLLLGRTRQNAA